MGLQSIRRRGHNPAQVRHRTEQRIRAYAEAHYSGTFERLEVRFRGALCYIDAYVEDPPEALLHLCRLRYVRNEDAWSMAFYIYSNEKLPQKATVDAFHIGIATAHHVEYLLTWNCKHLANATMRSTIEAICRSSDLRPPIICTPEELPSGSAT